MSLFIHYLQGTENTNVIAVSNPEMKDKIICTTLDPHLAIRIVKACNKRNSFMQLHAQKTEERQADRAMNSLVKHAAEKGALISDQTININNKPTLF